jgi:hypothetical protein
MIFAAIDYYNYRRQSGRYDKTRGTNLMCGSFAESLPDEVVSLLEPCDVIVSGNFECWKSWLIMYLTSSQTSHVAIYAGDKKIIHQTLGGAVYGPIEDLFGKNQRLLAIKIPPPIGGGQRRVLGQSDVTMMPNDTYPMGLVIKKGLLILIGRDRRRFRVKFLVDSILIFVVASAPVLLVQPQLVAFLGFSYLVFVAANLTVGYLSPLPADEKHGAPCDILWQLRQIGGVLLVDHSET